MEKLTLGEKIMMLAGGIGLAASLAASSYFSYQQGYKRGEQIAHDERYCQRQERMLRREHSWVHLDELISPHLRISCPEVYRSAANIKE